MTLKELYNYDNFVILGNTVNEEKIAYKIKKELIRVKKNVLSIPHEISSFNDITFNNYVLVNCINMYKGLEYLKDINNKCVCVILQDNSYNNDTLNLLDNKNISYIQGCALLMVKYYENK